MNEKQLRARILAVIEALDKISVIGIENQRRMIGCADFLSETAKMLESQLVSLDGEKKNDA